MTTDPLGLGTEPSPVVATLKSIAEAVGMPQVIPKGHRLEACERYLNQFDAEQINMFLLRLKTSAWVKNSSFGFDLMIRKDLVNVLLAGSTSLKSVMKFYNVQVLCIQKA